MEQQQEQQQEEPEHDRRLRPRIWVGSLRDYNDGRLHGEWLPADQEPGALEEAVQRMLAASPGGPGAEEWAIFDYTDFGGIRIDEYERWDVVAQLAHGVVTHGRPFATWVAHQGHDADPGKFEDAFLGHWETLDEYARSMLEDFGYQESIQRNVPDFLRPYIRLDGGAMARELLAEGAIYTEDAPDGGVWVFDATV